MYLPGVACERLACHGPLDVPDDHAPVLAGRDGGASVGADRGAHDRPVVAFGGGADLAGRQVEKANGAVAAAEQQRAIVRAQGRLVPAGGELYERARHLLELADAGQGPGVTDRRRATCAARHDAPIARELQRRGSDAATDEAQRAERPAGGRVKAPNRRVVRWDKDRGEQRAPVRGQAQGFDGPTVHGG